jgi:phosphoglycolate phosphatase
LLPDADEEEILRIISTYRERFSDVGFSENTIYSGIIEALEFFKTSNVRMGVCTSKRVDFAERILSLFDISDYFDFVSGGDIGITKAMQLSQLLENKSIDSDAVMVGDRAIDITSARANNLQGIGVLWGFGSYEELSGAKPSAILKSTKEFDSIIA